MVADSLDEQCTEKHKQRSKLRKLLGSMDRETPRFESRFEASDAKCLAERVTSRGSAVDEVEMCMVANGHDDVVCTAASVY